MWSVTDCIESNVFKALQFCEFFFRDTAEIGQVRYASYAESQYRHLPVNSAYRYHLNPFAVIYGWLDIVGRTGLNAAVRHPVAISHIVNPDQFPVFFVRVDSEWFVLYYVQMPFRGAGITWRREGVGIFSPKTIKDSCFAVDFGRPPVDVV